MASLNIAGAYHDVASLNIVDAYFHVDTRDVLHLFGTTATRDGDAPVYYYRTCKNLVASGVDKSVAPVWSPWQPITVQISSAMVSPVVYDGRLNVFWTSITTKPVNQVSGGTSSFYAYAHTMKTYFATLRQDGTWTSPQQVQLPSQDDYFPTLSAGQITDQVVKDSSKGWITYLGGSAAVQQDPKGNPVPVDGYTLSGPNWYGLWFKPSSSLQVQFRNYMEGRSLDLFNREVGDTRIDLTYSIIRVLSGRNPVSGAATRPLCSWTVTGLEGFYLTSGLANAVVDEQNLATLALEDPVGVGILRGQIDSAPQIATIPTGTELFAIPGSEEDGLL